MNIVALPARLPPPLGPAPFGVNLTRVLGGDMLIQGGTVITITNGDLENTDVLIRGDRIDQVGESIQIDFERSDIPGAVNAVRRIGVRPSGSTPAITASRRSGSSRSSSSSTVCSNAWRDVRARGPRGWALRDGRRDRLPAPAVANEVADLSERWNWAVCRKQ